MFPLVHSSSGVTVFSLLPQGIGLYDTYKKIQENQTKLQKRIVINHQQIKPCYFKIQFGT